jgi:hypothetical protein
MSSLRIFRDGGLHDAEKSGYFRNIVTGCPVCPGKELLPFFWNIKPIGDPLSPAISDFKLQGISEGFVVVVEYDLSNALITVTNNGVNYVGSYAADTDILTALGTYSNGVYRVKITCGTRVFYSEFFIINSFKYISIIGVGDFDLDDFDEDFY